MENIIKTTKEKGFSIVELVVVLAVFLIILDVMITLFLSMVQQQKRVLAEQELLNQVSYAMQNISHALMAASQDKTGSCIGTGNVYVLTHCVSAIPAVPCNGIKFVNQLENNECEEIYLDTSNPANPHVKVIKNGGTPQSLLSDSFTVKYAYFVLNGDKTVHIASDNDLVQPRATVLLDIKTQIPGNLQEKIVQTTVSKRDISER